MVARSAQEVSGRSWSLEDFSCVTQLPQQDPDATVEVEIAYSNLNYKDGMIVLGQKGVVRNWPIVPGIDFAGTVRHTRSPLFKEGDGVVLTGNKAGQFFDGGYAQRAACQAEHLVALPLDMSPLQAMALGTAGFTAAMCVLHLEQAGELQPEQGRVLVTGAAGGLGQVAVALLAARGFDVVASTGRAEQVGDHLRKLGATEVIGRLQPSGRPLDSQKWAGVVDSVGGSTLVAALSQTAYRGAVASTGVAGGGDFSGTVYPFILRGVRLLGVDSTLPWNLAGYPHDEALWRGWRQERIRVWQAMAECLPPEVIASLHSATIGLAEVPGQAEKILRGDVAGRVVVDVNA